MRRLDELALRSMDDGLDDAESAELDGLIADPALERRFLQLMDVHHGLRALAPASTDTRHLMQRIWRTEASGALRTVRRRIRPRRRRGPTAPVLGLALAAAAILVVALVLALASRSPAPGPQPESAQGPAPVPAEGAPAGEAVAVARLVAGERRLAAGARLALAQAGRVERLGEATAVELDGGSRLRLVSGQRWELERGRGDWRIAPQAPGSPFVIDTPQATITVVGTAFRLAVGPGASVIHMEHGRVHIAARRSQQTAELTAQESARITDAGEIEPLAGAPRALARWRFDGDDPALVVDRSGRGFDLRIEDPDRVERLDDGLRLVRPVRLSCVNPATPINRAIRASGAFTLVAELTPSRLPPEYDVAEVGTARIFTLSDSAYARNLTLGQGELGRPWSSGALRLRADRGRRNANGLPAHVVPEVFEPGRRVRLVFSYRAGEGLRVYRDGELVVEEPDRGPLTDWDPGFALALGAEVGVDADGMRPWLGTYHELALYAQALSPDELP